MGSTSLVSLMIVVTVAFLIPITLHKFKLRALPVVVAEIVAGLIIGKSGFNIVAEDQWLELLSLLGFIYLMFLSGVEIDFSIVRGKAKRRKGEPNPLSVSLIIFSLILLISYALALALVKFGFVSEPYLMTLIIATISLGVVMPVLKERKLMQTGLGQTVLLITVISDFITMILLAVYLSSLSQDFMKMILLIVFFLLVFLTYFLARRFSHNSFFAMLASGTAQLGTRAIFALILLFVVLSETLGVENILGAFLAGVIVSLLMPNRDFVQQLDTFGYGFLIPIFFVMVGINLDIWQLFADPKILLLIPLLIVFIFISKILPTLLLKMWYPWAKVIGVGFLMSSTLSLVIAASTIALQIGIISDQMHGALILVAIMTCLIFPILFNKVFPKEDEQPTTVAIVGANHVTLPVARDLLKSGYQVQMYSSQASDKDEEDAINSGIPHQFVTLNPESLAEHGVFESDVLVLGSMKDDTNIILTQHARELGLERIITRVEDPEKQNMLQREGIAVFSTLYASRFLLKALIEFPSAIQLITQNDDSIHEITVNNTAYHQVMLRHLPLTGHVLVLRIRRGETFIIPHGNTTIQVGDRLLTSGQMEQIQTMRNHLE